MSFSNRLVTARKELKSACAGFNCRYFVEHQKCDAGTELFRHDIYELTEGGFEVVKSSCIVSSVNARIGHTNLGRYSHYHLAKAAVESGVTVLELNGAEFLEDKEFPIANVLDEEQNIPTLLIDIPNGKELEYLGDGVVFAQKIPVGFRLFVAINPFGKVLVKSSCNDNALWEEASQAIKARLECLTKIEGARGLVLEIVMNCASVDIIDVWYLHDEWLKSLNTTQRHDRFKSYCQLHNINLKVLYGSRARVSGVSSLAVDEVKALIVEKEGLRYLVARNAWDMMISNGWKKKLNLVNLTSMENIGAVNGQYLPDMSYKSFKAAGQGVESFWY